MHCFKKNFRWSLSHLYLFSFTAGWKILEIPHLLELHFEATPVANFSCLLSTHSGLSLTPLRLSLTHQGLLSTLFGLFSTLLNSLHWKSSRSKSFLDWYWSPRRTRAFCPFHHRLVSTGRFFGRILCCCKHCWLVRSCWKKIGDWHL